MQVKLLRVIQEKTVRPVGGSRRDRRCAHPVGDPQGPRRRWSPASFREDLYYRINVIELHVPALRDRGDDVLLLAEHILAKLFAAFDAHADDRRAPRCSRYSFPGNVRELENMLERA